jgi:hypothetical protein
VVQAVVVQAAVVQAAVVQAVVVQAVVVQAAAAQAVAAQAVAAQAVAAQAVAAQAVAAQVVAAESARAAPVAPAVPEAAGPRPSAHATRDRTRGPAAPRASSSRSRTAHHPCGPCCWRSPSRCGRPARGRHGHRAAASQRRYGIARNSHRWRQREPARGPRPWSPRPAAQASPSRRNRPPPDSRRRAQAAVGSTAAAAERRAQGEPRGERVDAWVIPGCALVP